MNKRLTNHFAFMGGHSLESKCYNKLRDLEDLEEELGIGLETLFKAIKEGFYYRCEDEYGNLGKPCFCKAENIWAGRSCFLIQRRKNTSDGHFYDTVEYVPYNKYKNVWALTREELMKGSE